MKIEPIIAYLYLIFMASLYDLDLYCSQQPGSGGSLL